MPLRATLRVIGWLVQVSIIGAKELVNEISIKFSIRWLAFYGRSEGNEFVYIGGTASAVILDLMKLYIETDQ